MMKNADEAEIIFDDNYNDKWTFKQHDSHS